MSESVLTPPVAVAATPRGMKLRLWVMMFLQYFVQGCYLSVMTVYVKDALGFDSQHMGWFAAAFSLGPLAAPFVIGQIVDRHLATQWVLAFCHLAAGATMLAMYTQSEFLPIILLGTLYSVLYVPTMMLTNSLAFHHLRWRDREFPAVRLWGTIGFVVPAWVIEFYWLAGLQGDELNRARGIVFWLSGAAGILMAAYATTLPYTPPQRRGTFAPGIVVGMLRQRNFRVLVLVTFFIAIVHSYHFLWNGPFLTTVLRNEKIESAWEQRISSIGQISEIGVMLLLGLLIVRIGFKHTMVIGGLAYVARCLTFALAATVGPPWELWLACIGQALHGLCFGCFLATAYMYVDRVAPPDVRGSMQNVFGTFIIGLGAVTAGVVGGWLGSIFGSGVGADRDYDWPDIWLAGAALAASCVIAFTFLFPRDTPAP